MSPPIQTLGPLLLLWTTAHAAEPCNDAADEAACREKVQDVVKTFGEEEQALCSAIDQFDPDAHRGNQIGEGLLGASTTCFTAREDNECYQHIIWARDHGRWEHPEWYGPMPHYVKYFDDINGAWNDDFQMYFFCNPYFENMPHNCGAPVCGRQCETHDGDDERKMDDIEGRMDDEADTMNENTLSDYCNSNEVNSQINWNNQDGQYNCDAVRNTCAQNNGQDCDEVAQQFCSDNPVVPYKEKEMCNNPDDASANGYDAVAYRAGGERRLLRWRWRWWRVGKWFLCHAAYGFSLALFGGFGLYAAANCDLFMTRMVIRCLVYFGLSPFSALCAAGWMTALTYACQAIVGATTLAVQQFFMYFIRCGKKPSFRRRMLYLDDATNGKRVAFANNAVLPEVFQAPMDSYHSFMRRLQAEVEPRVIAPDTCLCLTKISGDQANALANVIGNGITDMRAECATERTDCSAITNRRSCIEAEGCRFDKATKLCTAFVSSACGMITHKWNCLATEGCNWLQQRCVVGAPSEDAVPECSRLNKKKCKRVDGFCRWLRKEKECVSAEL